MASNLFGDIVTDLGAAMRAAWDWRRALTSIPRDVTQAASRRSTAQRLTSRAKAWPTPIAKIWSVSMMLDHLGEKEPGAAVLGAAESVMAAGKVRTPDLGGSAATRQMGQAIIAALRNPN